MRFFKTTIRKRSSITLSAFLIFLPILSQAQDGEEDTRLVPITDVFYKVGDHLAGSLTVNYGLNYLLAGAGTYGIVKSGLDWRWYRNAQDHKWISDAGFVFVGIGPLASVAVPVGLYLYGRSKEDVRLQYTGLALGQAAILAGVMTSALKAFTGRVPPDSPDNPHDYSGEFRFGFLRGGVYEGWPSSHTATAFAMATTLMELYPESAVTRYGGLAYASLIGLGVSTNIHWFSDAVAGALIGYAIGKTVGSGFRNLLDQKGEQQSFSFFVTPSRVGFTYRF
jgi:membrane-associated phospholipid phosphatase